MYSFILCAQDTTQRSFQDKMNSSFSSFKSSQQKSFNNFKEKQQQAFDRFKKEIQKKWGEQNFMYSDSVTWVEYHDDHESRSSVNFKEGVATVDIILDPEQANDKEAVREKMQEAIEKLAVSKGKVDDLETNETENNELSEESILKDQLVDEEGNKIDTNNVEDFAENIVEKEDVDRQEIIGSDGEKRVMISVSIPLAPDYLQVRARDVLPIITKYANQYNIEPELILGVIHIESYFNPKAISHANAIGLMQLVPSSGGLDSYEYVYGESKVPSHDYLYNPENNIHLGTAYMQKLMEVYFKNIDGQENKRYCSIAAYNTGVGNVCSAVSHTTKITPTVQQINKMSSTDTYDYLLQNLKYKEARNYLKKVNEKYLMYQSWMNE
jgi:membrane-bound lytic murein transglycosylase C